MKLKIVFTLIIFLSITNDTYSYEIVYKQIPVSEFVIGKCIYKNPNEILALTPALIKLKTGYSLTFKEVHTLKKLQRELNKKNTNPKNQLLALGLVWFLGIWGVHRFYLGYTGIAIIQLLTAGMCGIWTLIDLIRIITGDLKPKDGSDYDPTL